MTEFHEVRAESVHPTQIPRREFIRKSLMLSGGAFAAMSSGSRVGMPKLSANNMPMMAATGFIIHGNNGVGNGLDPQPPGDPPINDGPGTGPGNPGNQGGGNGNGNGGNGNANRRGRGNGG